MKLPTKCPHCGLTYDRNTYRLACPYCGNNPYPDDCPDPLCILDMPDPTACLNCPNKPKPHPGWGGKRARAGAPQGNINRLIHGYQSKLMTKGIARLADDPELRGILLIITRLAVNGKLPPETRKLILKINPQSQRGQQVKRLIKQQKAARGVKR